MALQSKSKLFFAAIFALSTVACSGPKHSKEVLCEVKGSGSSLQFVRYLQTSYPRIGRVAGGESRYEGIYFDAGVKFWNSRWIIDHVDFSWDKNYVEDACKKNSKIDGGLVVLFPVQRQFHSSSVMSPRNRAVISTDGGATFNLVRFPEDGSPYLIDKDSRLLTYPGWRSYSIAINQDVLELRQVTILIEPFNFRGVKGRREDLSDWLDLSGKNCEECEPIIYRDLESSDRGKSWRIKSFGVLRPEGIPKNAVMPLVSKNSYWAQERDFSTIFHLVECPENSSSLPPGSIRRQCFLEGTITPLK